MERFDMVANKMSYPQNVKSGRFYWPNQWIAMYLWAMRMNIPVKLAFNNQERVENFAGRVGSQLRQIVCSLFKDSIF
jgi:UPF0755 protein